MRWRGLAGIVALSSALIAGMSAGVAQAQAPSTFTLEPGGKATITFNAFCTNFGKKFPMSIQAPNAVAPDAQRAAVAYIQSSNLAATPQQALEAQYGLWQVIGATNSPVGGDVAKAVVNAAKTAPVTPAGTSVVDAAKQNQVKLTLNSWTPTGDKVQFGTATDNFYGSGTLTVENSSQQRLTLSMPAGTLFPPTTAGEQTMAGFATKVDVANPQTTTKPTTLPATGGRETHTLLLGFAITLLLGAGALRVFRRMN